VGGREVDERSQAWYGAMRAGDERAFEALFHAHYAPLCRFLREYLRSPAVIEELVQDLFLRLWRDRARLPVRGSVRAYLYVSARNSALNHLRHERFVRRLQSRWAAGDREPSLEPGARTPEGEAAAHELAGAIRSAIQSLPERARLAATLRWEHQLSYAEIAEIMEISVKGVENQLGRIMKALRPALEPFHS